MIHTDFFNDYPLIGFTLEKNKRRIQAKAIVDTGSPYTILSKNALKGLDLQEQDIAMEVKIHGVIHKEGFLTHVFRLINRFLYDNRTFAKIKTG